MMDVQHNSSEESHTSDIRQAADHILVLIGRLLGGKHQVVTQEGAPAEGLSTINPVVDTGTPDELRSLAASAQERLIQKTSANHDHQELEERQKIKVLLQTHLNDSMWNELLSHVRPAAERGESQLQLLCFPSNLCTDGGRKIRVGEEGWQDTLQGEAAELRARWDRDLAQKGFGLAASTVEYRGDIPGDIGLFLTWHG